MTYFTEAPLYERIAELESRLAEAKAEIEANAKIIAAAEAYDTAISDMERYHKRPDLYFTQHTTLLPLRQAVREKRELK